MTNEELEKKIEKLDALAQKNYDNFQDSGEQRYYRAYDRYSDEADVYRQALAANDEHISLLHLRGAVSQCLAEYEKTEYKSTAEAYDIMRNALHNLKSYCEFVSK